MTVQGRAGEREEAFDCCTFCTCRSPRSDGSWQQAEWRQVQHQLGIWAMHAVIDSVVCCLALLHSGVGSGNPSSPQCRQVATRGAARMLGGLGYASAQGTRGCTFASRALGGAGFAGRAHFWAVWRALRAARAASAARPVPTRGMAACRCHDAMRVPGCCCFLTVDSEHVLCLLLLV